MFENAKEEIINLENELVELINQSNPFEVLTELYTLYSLSKIFTMQRKLSEIEDMNNEFNIENKFRGESLKHFEFLQRIYHSDNITFGTKKVNPLDVNEILNKLFINQSIEKFKVNSDKFSPGMILNSLRSTISYNIHPCLFTEYYSLVNQYMIKDDYKRQQVNELLQDIEDRVTKFSFPMLNDTDNSVNTEQYTIDPNNIDLSKFIQSSENEINMNDVNIKPFLKKGSDLYLFNSHVVIDNYYYMLRTQLLEKINANEFNDRQAHMTEELAAIFLKKLLPSSKLFSNVKYSTSTGAYKKKNTCELDILCEIDDVLLICEVKGSLLFQRDFQKDAVALEKNIQKLIIEPFEQSKRFYDELKSNGKVNIKGTDKQLNFPDYSQVYFINITMEHLDSVASNVEREIGSKVPTINIPLSDLFQYSLLFEHQADFLNYLHQRVKFIEKHGIYIYDEFVHHGLYIAHNDYSVTFDNMLESNNKITRDICKDNIYIDIDEYRGISDDYITKLKFGDNCDFGVIDSTLEYIKPELPQRNERIDIVNLILDKSEKSNSTTARNTARKILLLSNSEELKFDIPNDMLRRITSYKKMKTMFNFPRMALQFDNDELWYTYMHIDSVLYSNINEQRKFFSVRINKIKDCVIFGIDDAGVICDVIFLKSDFGNNIFEKEEFELEKEQFEFMINQLSL